MAGDASSSLRDWATDTRHTERARSERPSCETYACPPQGPGCLSASDFRTLSAKGKRQSHSIEIHSEADPCIAHQLVQLRRVVGDVAVPKLPLQKSVVSTSDDFYSGKNVEVSIALIACRWQGTGRVVGCRRYRSPPRGRYTPPSNVDSYCGFTNEADRPVNRKLQVASALSGTFSQESVAAKAVLCCEFPAIRNLMVVALWHLGVRMPVDCRLELPRDICPKQADGQSLLGKNIPGRAQCMRYGPEEEQVGIRPVACEGLLRADVVGRENRKPELHRIVPTGCRQPVCPWKKPRTSEEPVERSFALDCTVDGHVEASGIVPVFSPSREQIVINAQSDSLVISAFDSSERCGGRVFGRQARLFATQSWIQNRSEKACAQEVPSRPSGHSALRFSFHVAVPGMTSILRSTLRSRVITHHARSATIHV